MGSTHIAVGELEIFVIDDHIGSERNPADVFVDVPPEQWDPHRHYALNEDGMWVSQWRGHLIRRADGSGKQILVDTGMGPGPYDHGNLEGELIKNLTILPSLSGSLTKIDEISDVVITHCHGDHIGWNTQLVNDTPTPTFPKATYHIAKRDWEHYTKHENKDDVFEAQVRPLKDLGTLNLVSGELELMEGVQIFPTNGHTPGHQCVFVRSKGQTAVLTGDLFHNVAQIAEQHWCPVFDWRTDLSTASRRWLLWRAMVEDWIVVSGHLPTGMSIGKIEECNGTPTWKPI